MPQQRKRLIDLDLPDLIVHKKTKNCFENLSNEIIYEIFDYLSGCNIYRGFSKLNYRYTCLLENSSIRYKICVIKESENDLTLIRQMEKQIVSFNFLNPLLADKIFPLTLTDFSFSNLQSIVLFEETATKLAIHLFYMQQLPKLSSLSIYLETCHENVGDFYQIIFQYSSLKYFKFTITAIDNSVLFTIPWNYPNLRSPIEYLSIGHDCTYIEFASILSYTPQLSHIHCSIDFDLDDDTSFNLPKDCQLTYLNMYFCNFELSRFQNILSQFCSNLHTLVLRSIQTSNRSYFDGDRWAKFLETYMPRLNRINLSFTERIDETFHVHSDHSLLNRFTSSFWRKHQCYLTIYLCNGRLTYKIDQHKDKWFDNHRIDIRNSIFDRKNQSHIDKIIPLLELMEIQCLNIDYKKISPDKLLKIFNSLRNLHSIRIE